MLVKAMSCPYDHPHLVITTYGLINSNPNDFMYNRHHPSSYFWDYIILDEGHQIKNPNTSKSKALKRISSNLNTHLLLLTGTPIQNNLKELWALFDWATKGRVLGNLARFMNKFARPIEDGRDKDASEWTIRTAEKANIMLQQQIRPYFLQRMKNIEFKNNLPLKREIVVWTHLSLFQRKMYEKYLIDGGKVSAVLSGEITSPLEAITYLKKLCGHPCLVAPNLGFMDPPRLIKHSAKLVVLVDLVQRLCKSKHKCLIFSQSTKMLDIIEKVLPIKMSRIDGSVKGAERQKIVDTFNNDISDCHVMLLSTKAAGVGLNLTGADRAIIYDPSWNPADDSQAVDRCYRIGQKNDVTIYRFIAAGTVEERMYEKQVQKDGIRRTITTNSGCATERYFSSDDLHRLFKLNAEGECEFLGKLNKNENPCAVGASGKTSFLENHDRVVGLSSHDMVYTSTVIDFTETKRSPFEGSTQKQNDPPDSVDKVVHSIEHLNENMKNLKLSGNRVDCSPLNKSADDYQSKASIYNSTKSNKCLEVSKLRAMNVKSKVEIRNHAIPLGKKYT
eukprot:CAMPEP_0184870294 /NCGR_PEP_ID=MMETSP0580-20130426/37009_1 /TAXON_ID=1118495 /ORGANISM="Dactyliosolen fragilissimus" /LENGTH=559 /DNA_ID=CAMNT_0027372299 /DNA_START=151 /DNA_END=1830 /DNA_ORIENTATION=+